MTHFDRCAPWHRTRCKQKNISSGLCVCAKYVNSYSISCAYACVCKLICVHVSLAQRGGHMSGRVRSQGARQNTLYNKKSHRPDWLVHLTVACNGPPGWPNPPICKLLLQASGFKRASSTMSLSHRPWRPWKVYICTVHINTHSYIVHTFTWEPKPTFNLRQMHRQVQSKGKWFLKESLIIWCNVLFMKEWVEVSGWGGQRLGVKGGKIQGRPHAAGSCTCSNSLHTRGMTEMWSTRFTC